MRFAAGLTLSGIVGFLFLELLKLILPTLATWTLGILAVALKVFMVAFTLMLGLGVLGLLLFLYRRSQRARVEA